MLSKTLAAIKAKMTATTALMVVGVDGFIIEQHCDPAASVSAEATAAEVAGLFRQAQSSSLELGVGRLEELSLRTDQFLVLAQKITDDYFLCMVLPVGEFSGRALFELKKAGERLREEFVI
jgi:predicted regulator of Ras-like GTPase activity (Roadblock/LC7/MglB family)